MSRHLATIGRLTVWDLSDVPDIRPALRFVGKSMGESEVLDLDQCVDLARLLVKFAAKHGWGSDEDKERIIAWAQVKK
jgi:hypothetical protein